MKINNQFGISIFLCLVLPTASVFAAEEDSWTTMEPMSTSRSWLGVAVVDGKIYAMVDEINYQYDPQQTRGLQRRQCQTREIVLARVHVLF